jgi:hypothetical protein
VIRILIRIFYKLTQKPENILRKGLTEDNISESWRELLLFLPFSAKKCNIIITFVIRHGLYKIIMGQNKGFLIYFLEILDKKGKKWRELLADEYLTMYVRGYLQGSENGRVATIERKAAMWLVN